MNRVSINVISRASALCMSVYELGCQMDPLGYTLYVYMYRDKWSYLLAAAVMAGVVLAVDEEIVG